MVQSKYLLDVNFLLALAWPHHQFNPKAAAWFSEHAHEGWSTCTVTELGFIRLSSNPAFTSEASTPKIAAKLLDKLTEQGVHVFLGSASVKNLQGVAESPGHKQVTDTYLCALASFHGVRLVTFDSRMAASKNILVLSA